MIYKSRNGIGIPVILITLFFFFMLTDAEPKNMEGLAKICAQPDCYHPSITPNSINPNLNEVNGLYAKAQSTAVAIKNIKEEEIHTLFCRRVFRFFAIVALAMIIYCLAKDFWIKYTEMLKVENGIWATRKKIYVPYCPFYAQVIYAVLVILFVVFLICGCSYRDYEMEACHDLKVGIEEEFLIAVDPRMITFIEMKIEESIRNNGYFSKEEIKDSMEMWIAEFEEIKEQEVMDETEFEKITEKEDVKKAEKIKFMGETRSEEIKTKEDSGKKVSEVENAKKFSEETDISMESESTITDTSTKYDQESVTSQFITRSLAQKRKKNYGGEKRRKKKGAQAECILVNIDFNLLIYAMVFLFALFAICTICYLKEEEATGEIKEEEATGEINEV